MPIRQKHKHSDENNEDANDSTGRYFAVTKQRKIHPATLFSVTAVRDDLEIHVSEANQARQNNIPRSNKQKRVGWPRGSSDVKVSHPLIVACCAIPQEQDSKSKADGSTRRSHTKGCYTTSMWLCIYKT